jgi:beta-aspartyl-peptidase (threonine type)
MASTEPSSGAAGGPVAAIHAGAGTVRLRDTDGRYARALTEALRRAGAVLGDGGAAVDGATAAVTFMEDEVDFFNAGRGSVLTSAATVEMAAALMRGEDRAAGAVAAVSRTRFPILAAWAVLEHSPHVLMVGTAAEAVAFSHGLEERGPSYFITDRQRERLRDLGSKFVEGGTVGAVCRDADGRLPAATTTGGMRGQAPGRVGDSPLIGAGTWADERVAISCTGDGEAFIRVGVARLIAALVAGGSDLSDAAALALDEVASLGGHGGLIAVDQTGRVALPFHDGAMPRGVWRPGSLPSVWA